MGPSIPILLSALLCWSHGAPNPSPAYGIFPLPQVYNNRAPGGFFYFPSLDSVRHHLTPSGSRDRDGPPQSDVAKNLAGSETQVSGVGEVSHASPGYDSQLNYDQNLREEKTFVATSGEHVLLMFHHIDLEPPNKKGECYDYVEVRSDLNQVAGEKFCGTKTDAEPILSVGNKLSVSFHSDDSRGAKGFKSSVWEVSKVETNHRHETYENWGPEFKISFDLMILKEVDELQSIFAFLGDHFESAPLILLEDLVLHFRTTDSLAGEEFSYDYPVQAKKWIKIEITQTRQTDATYDYSIKVNDAEVDRVEEVSASALEDVSAWATHEALTPASAVYKNLVVRPVTSRLFRSLDINPTKTDVGGSRIPADTLQLQTVLTF